MTHLLRLDEPYRGAHPHDARPRLHHLAFHPTPLDGVEVPARPTCRALMRLAVSMRVGGWFPKVARSVLAGSEPPSGGPGHDTSPNVVAQRRLAQLDGPTRAYDGRGHRQRANRNRPEELHREPPDNPFVAGLEPFDGAGE